MARTKLLKLHKVKCIRSLFFAIFYSQRKHTGHWWLRTSIKLLRNSLINFKRLAAFAGVSITSLLTANSLFAENPKLSSKLFLDLDEDGHLDLIDASDNGDDLIRTEIYPDSNSDNYNYVNGPNFDADLVGAVEDDLILLQKSTGEYAFIKNNGSENFSVAQSGYIGSPVNEAVLSDFDQDGDDDVVFATPGAIGWLKNDGTDGFATQETLVDGLPNDVHSLDISDNDYDGDSEIKFRYEGISGMLKNEGTEGFSIDHSYDSYEDFHIHQHDLNDDGTPEAITVKENGLVGISKSNGTEGFETQYLDLDNEVDSSFLNDLDNDGDDDLVFTTPSGGIGWAKNEGSDGFVAQQNLLFQGSSAIEVIEGDDFDHDGDNDILFTQNGLPGYGILKNDGSENFVPELSDTDTSLVYDDINDDGMDDVISVNQSGLVGINQSQGSEGFNAQLLDIDNEIDSIHLADLDSDGDDDLVFATFTGGIGWAKNEGSDGFVVQQNLLFQGSSAIETTEIDDVDHDGNNDILFTQNGLPGYGILKNDGSENFAFQDHSYELAEPEEVASSIALDTDADNDADIVQADGDSENLAIHLNENQGWEETNSQDLAFSPDGVAPIDLDGDEHKDLFAIEQGTGEHALLSNQGSDGFVVAQSGSFDTPVLESVLADIDFDGDQDLIYSDQTNLAWAKNDGSNGFIPQVPIESGIGEIASIEVGDFDNDGDHDIIYSQPNSGNVSLLSNQGEGIFDSQEIDSGATSIEDMQLADLDGDGDDDLLFASSQDSAIGWFANNGSEGFQPGQNLAEGIDQVDQIKVADLDLDDDLDIVAASNQHDESYWIQNSGSDGFIPNQLG